MERLVRSLAMLLLICLAVRIGSALVGPALPLLAVVFVFALIGLLLFGRPRSNGWERFRK
jgi:hypothetical protein